MKAFVLGASSSMGVAIVKELHKRGIATVAAARNEDQLTTLFSNLDVETKSCDAFLLNELHDCTRGCSHLFMALNIPYGNWRTGLPILFRNIIDTARKENLSIILVDNIYCYGEQKEQHWNISRAGTITGHEVIEIARKFSSYDHSVTTINRRMLGLAGLFSSQLREVKELFYLYEKPHILSGSKYEKEIGPLPKTPYEKGITETLKSLISR